MGDVYLAHDLTLDRRVAIKFLNPSHAANPAGRRRLLREARAAAALDHPNICTVHQILEEPDGRTCIVMQYVEGETLAEMLRRGALEPRLALSLTCDVAEALAAAHARGIIHRDIKPQNVMVTPDRRARLLDFGIARILEPPAAAGVDTTHTGSTGDGMFVGTLPYMSPEQAQQHGIDARSDLFSLGAVFFECLTGRRAFDGRTSMDLFAQILDHQPPPVSSLRPELTDRYDEICARLLAKHPDDRFRSAEELLGALRVAAPDTRRATAATAVRTMPPSRRALFVALGSVVVLAVAGVYQWRTAGAGRAGNEWYQLGTAFVRDGAYHSARLALDRAVQVTPDHAEAYLRLAEAHSELDDIVKAQEALLTVGGLLRERVQLSADDRLRVDALQALLTRRLDDAVAKFGELTRRRPRDADAWLDLGRTQDAAAMTTDALASYERALQIEPNYAAARMRRGSLLATLGRRADALRDFDEAEELYQAASNAEGRIEVLLRRGTFLNALGDSKAARGPLETARDLANGLGNRSQALRAEIQLSSVTAWEGHFAEAETLATGAVNQALTEGFDMVAADGLVDLATVYIQRRRLAEADVHLQRAIHLAEPRQAMRIVTRARLQQASALLGELKRQEAIDTATRALEYSEAHRYPRFVLKARSIISRSLAGLGQHAEARRAALAVLADARRIPDEGQVAEALETLAGSATALGALSEALTYRTEALKINENEPAVLPFDLTNSAELLMRLGRSAEAAALLDRLDAGVAQKVDAFARRARRAQVLRALDAAINLRFDETRRLAGAIVADATVDSSRHLALALLQFAERGATGPKPAADAPLSVAHPSEREVLYWTLAARLGAGDARGALAGVSELLQSGQAAVSPEFEWRLAALGAAAAARAGDRRAADLRARAAAALARTRALLTSDAATYGARPDLVDLRAKAGLANRP